MRGAARPCGCSPASTATRPPGPGRRARLAGSWRSKSIPTSGAGRGRRSRRTAGAPRSAPLRCSCASAGGCSRRRRPRSWRSGRGGGERGCREAGGAAAARRTLRLEERPDGAGTRDRGQVPEGRGAEARRSACAARDPHRGRSALPRAPALRGRDRAHAARPRGGGPRRDVPRAGGAHPQPAPRRQHAGGLLECAWPGQPFLERQITRGQLLLVTGPVRYYHGRQLVPREFVVLADDGEAPPEERGLVLPVYHATEGLTHRQIRGLVRQHLDALLGLVQDPHPPPLRAAVGVPELRAALAAVHRPASLAEAEAGRRRLAFDELFDQQLVQARARALAKRARAGIRFELKKALTTRLKEHLPFALTADQR